MCVHVCSGGGAGACLAARRRRARHAGACAGETGTACGEEAADMGWEIFRVGVDLSHIARTEACSFEAIPLLLPIPVHPPTHHDARNNNNGSMLALTLCACREGGAL